MGSSIYPINVNLGEVRESIIPNANQSYDIGDTTPLMFRKLYASTTRTGGEGGFFLYNSTDSQTHSWTFNGNNQSCIDAATLKLYTVLHTGACRPNTNAAYSLGVSASNWDELWLDNGPADGGKIYFDNGGANITCNADHSTLTFNTFGRLDLSCGEIKLKYYSQSAEPTLANNQHMALWEDTDDSSVHLLVKNSAGAQTKLSFV